MKYTKYMRYRFIVLGPSLTPQGIKYWIIVDAWGRVVNYEHSEDAAWAWIHAQEMGA
jgi:hypothetical protein